MTELPSITIHPGYQFGRPCLEGTRIPTTSVVECVLAGDSVDGTALAYGVSREAILAACWYEGQYGNRSNRKHLRKWSEKWFAALAGHSGAVSDVPDPPPFGRSP